MPVDHEFPVAFDCIENYSLPLSVGELDTVLPEAKQMDGRPLFLQPHTVSDGIRPPALRKMYNRTLRC